MRGGKKMIYKNISFKAAPFSYDLFFDDRITLVGGDSGTGKTVLYEILEDLKLTEEYNAIKLFNYKSENMKENLKKCRANPTRQIVHSPEKICDIYMYYT